jgi:hypothetical protein
MAMLILLMLQAAAWVNPGTEPNPWRLLKHAQFIADMSAGRYAVSDSLCAQAFGSAAVDTIIISDRKQLKKVLELRRYFPAGITVEQLELSPNGSWLYVTATGNWGDLGPRTKVMKADLAPGVDAIRFEEAIARDFFGDQQRDPDIDTRGDVYYVFGQVQHGLADVGWLARSSGPDVFMLTADGWIKIGAHLRTNTDGELLMESGVRHKLISGRKPTIAYSNSLEPVGIFFEAPAHEDGAQYPNVYFADRQGTVLRVDAGEAAGETAQYRRLQPGSIDEFLHRAYDGERRSVGFLHKGCGTIQDGYVRSEGHYMLATPSGGLGNPFHFKAQKIPMQSGVIPSTGNPHPH